VALWIRTFAATLIAVTLLSCAAFAAEGGKKCRLEGRVTDLFGMALKGAKIQLEHTTGKPSKEVLADSNGDFLFSRWEAGTYELRASLPGFETRLLVVELAETRPVRRIALGLHLVRLTDDPLCRVIGQVLDNDNEKPLPGAVVKAVAAFDKDLELSTVAGRDGGFTLEIGIAAQFLVVAHSPGFRVRAEEIICQAGQQPTLSLSLERLWPP